MIKDKLICPKCGRVFYRSFRKYRNPFCSSCQLDNRIREGLNEEEARELRKIKTKNKIEERLKPELNIIAEMRSRGKSFGKIADAIGFSRRYTYELWIKHIKIKE